MKIPTWLNPFARRKIRKILMKTFEGTPTTIEKIGYLTAEDISNSMCRVFVAINNESLRRGNKLLRNDPFFADYWFSRTCGHIRIDLAKELVYLEDFILLEDILPNYEIQTTRLVRTSD